MSTSASNHSLSHPARISRASSSASGGGGGGGSSEGHGKGEGKRSESEEGSFDMMEFGKKEREVEEEEVGYAV